MCGISGFVERRRDRSSAELRSTATHMAATLYHRGPDDDGVWSDERYGVGLGFQRLSIIDLTAAGHQPMVSTDGKVVIVFNGELYNHRELRQQLERVGARFRGHADSEVLVEAIARWGLRSTLDRANGMFGFAAWNRGTATLSLARDRFGEKPLYYALTDRSFLFGSELKALRGHPDMPQDIDRGALALFLRHGYVPSPYAIHSGVRKVCPGSVVHLDADAWVVRDSRYWSALQVASEGMATSEPLENDSAVDALSDALSRSVKLRMLADVPVGAFLSGGIDSSTVVALMQAASTRPVRTFSIGFEEPGYDEAPYAAAVARRLGTQHTELYVTPAEALAVVPRLPTVYDEPFADSSQIPTMLVAELARRDVAVSLSGDGGDELFGGYPRYRLQRRAWHALQRVPRGVRLATARVVDRVPDAMWQRMAPIAGRIGGRGMIERDLASYARRGTAAFAAADAHAMYRSLVSLWPEPTSIVLDGHEPPTALTDPGAGLAGADAMSSAMYLDAVTYLPDDILVKVDRATMAASLEARVPLLDPEVFALAWRMPLSTKVRGGVVKWPLRQVLGAYIEPALVDRPKVGFGVPIGAWLRGPLRSWGEELLSVDRVRAEGYFDADRVRHAWDDHQSGRANRQYQLWALLMFQAWVGAWANSNP